MAGVLGIEPRSSVLETDILTAVLYPYIVNSSYCTKFDLCTLYLAVITVTFLCLLERHA